MGVEAYEDGGSRGGVGWGGVGWGTRGPGPSWEPLGRSWGFLFGCLGRLLGGLGRLLVCFAASWAVWGVVLGGVGAISARLEAILGPDAAKLDNCPGRLENGSGC